MKLSGHNFENEVFNSLLDGISNDVELKKTAQAESAPDVSNFFSSTTAETFSDVQREELENIAHELAFAAERSKVAINAEDLAKFATQVQKESLRGKKLERAAQKYCNQLDRAIATPQGMMKISTEDLINQLSSHKVVPASHDPKFGDNDSLTGKYLGSSKNPNSIWDFEALQRLAGKQDEGPKSQFGDEEITKGRKIQAEAKSAWADKFPSSEQLKEEAEVMKMNSKVASTTTPGSDNANSKLPANTMSIFSSNRDFENIPDKTVGEDIIAKAEARANKKAESQQEERDIQRPMNTRDAVDKLF